MTDKAALFDLDGTLIESGPGIIAAMRHAMQAIGAPVAPGTDLAWVVGPPLADVFARLLTPLGRTAEIDAAMELYRADYNAGRMFEAAVYPAIRETLAAFADAGWTLFVATSKPQAVARTILAQHRLTQPFRVIYGAIDDRRLAHKPELIAHILRAEALDPRRTVMIGDRSFDIAGAHANAVRAIGALWGYGGAAELEQAGADALALAPADLPGAAAGLLQSGSDA